MAKPRWRDFQRQIARKSDRNLDSRYNGGNPHNALSRNLKAKKEKNNIWLGFGTFGMVGWSVAIPTLLCISLGVWIDTHVESKYSWTLMLLFVGIVLGCLNAWYWITKESQSD